MKRKTEFDIEKLSRKRQRNVQEQITLTKHGIKTQAQYWRQEGLPLPLIQLFETKGVDVKTSIVLWYDQDFPGSSTDEGLLLTEDGRFFEFDVDLNPERSQLVELYLWEDVSHRYEINGHKKGLGKTYGFLAMEVLQELNQERRSTQ